MIKPSTEHFIEWALINYIPEKTPTGYIWYQRLDSNPIAITTKVLVKIYDDSHPLVFEKIKPGTGIKPESGFEFDELIDFIEKRMSNSAPKPVPHGTKSVEYNGFRVAVGDFIKHQEGKTYKVTSLMHNGIWVREEKAGLVFPNFIRTKDLPSFTHIPPPVQHHGISKAQLHGEITPPASYLGDKPGQVLQNNGSKFGQWIDPPKMTLAEFVKNYIETNSMIKVWRAIKGGHEIVTVEPAVSMQWEFLKGRGPHYHFKDRPVVGITSIYDPKFYPEAINIVIE